ncbi:WD40 repeat-like protein [Mycena kentingensis (nom. inval.)]|nr:WD40 repeat-like protein [Mycena kentingensis (nom. inval.)]
MYSARVRFLAHRHILASRWQADFDRVAVLGNDSQGHQGCVNALSWANDQLLLSGSDDRTYGYSSWKYAPTNTEQVSKSGQWIRPSQIPQTIPSYLVPPSTRDTEPTYSTFTVCHIRVACMSASVGGDGEVQVHEFEAPHACTHVLRCHENRTKRICTEESPHLFLTVAEDGSVRQHDLRMSHSCYRGGCPPPLLSVDFELSTLSLSPLTPYQFVVAGESEYGLLFDRRQAGRFLLAERGAVENGMTYCVRRFGRPTTRPEGEPRLSLRREHITGSRMSAANGHQLLLSYSGDAVYLYSTLDPVDADDMRRSVRDQDEEMSEESRDAYSRVPTVQPQRRYRGARNVATVKDVNFLGPNDDFVASGSDCGNLFIWNKETGELHALLEGDATTVNVIEGHPSLPLFACSGIDETIKLFAPVSCGRPSAFSRMDQAGRILAGNARPSMGFLQRHHFAALLARLDVEDAETECNHQ